MSEENKRIEKQIADWNPAEAKMRGTLKCDIDFRFSIDGTDEIAELEITEPKEKVEEVVTSKIVSIGKRNKRGLF